MLKKFILLTLVIEILGLNGYVTNAANVKAVKNIALHKTVNLSPSPNYKLCTDSGDKIQLTDGKLTKGYFWSQKSTVGWTRKQPVITVDLGQVQPISGFSLNSAAGRAGVEWPVMILLMVSDDGEKYYPVGNLVELSETEAPKPNVYKIHRYITRKVKTSGRYVKFMIISSGPYIFTDEVEVCAGPDSFKAISRGKPMLVTDFLQTKLMTSYIKVRFNRDLTAVTELLKNAKINDKTKQAISTKLQTLTGSLNKQAMQIKHEGFKAIMPYNQWHKQLIALRGDIWRATGLKKLTVSNGNRWDMLGFWDKPVNRTLQPVTITLMRNEQRSGVINISNPLPHTAKISLSLTGNIPNRLLSFSQVEWVDTKKGIPVAAALVPLKKSTPLSVVPGMTRQLWIQADSANIAAGSYKGNLILNAGADGNMTVPVVIELAPLTFPKRPRLHVGGWDYTDSVPSRGICKSNIEQVVKYLQERYVDVPWASPPTMPIGNFNKAGKMTVPPNTKRFDAWIKRWPDARIYAVFLNVPDNIRGIEMGSPAFNIAVANWIKWWEKHCLKQGIKPNQMALLLVDEPHSKTQDDIILTWAKVIKATCPEFIIWEDPTWRTPDQHSKAMLDISDVLCPNRPLYLTNKAYHDFYTKRAKKQTLWLYSCSGPSRLLDPYSYFLLQGWECMKIGAKSTHFWAFGDTGGGKSSWNPYLQKGTSYVPFYLDETSVTPAKYMEAIAESVRDYEYFIMLKNAVTAAKKRGNNSKTVVDAEKLLKSGPEQVLGAKGVSAIHWQDGKERTIADQIRIRMLKLLIKLSK
jgi:F5/8 type C domain